MIWATVLAACLCMCAIFIYNDSKTQEIQRQQSQQQAMGEACLHHVHNMSASADASLKDVYSFSDTVKDPEYVKWQGAMQCLTQYPLYSGQPNYMEFNTKL